jgi:transmembrane sensor
MEQLRLITLIEKLKANTATESEIQELDELYLDFEQKPGYTDQLNTNQREAYKEMLYGRIHVSINSNEHHGHTNNVRKLTWLRISTVAASVIIFLSAGTYLLFHKKQPIHEIVKTQRHDVAPGGNKAYLTLANGKTITLTGAQNGVLAKEGNAVINKTTDGEVVYQATPNGVNTKTEAAPNTLSTPAGGKYDLILSDGTKVWLNALSSIKYPSQFTGNERKVEITGEAYFEVAHNAEKPFKVMTNGQTVEVLGTHFNINAYPDEPFLKTTLLEGSIKVSKGPEHALLKPGQLSEISFKNNSINIVNDANAEEAIAWKNGYFRFESIELKALMRQVSRWYDIEIIYRGEIQKHEFFMDMKRKTNLSNVLKILEQGGIHFKIEERKLIVTP